jgi:TonB family protein
LALGAVDEPPRIVRADAPAYPDRAERRREEATVRLHAVIDAEGHVTAVEVQCDGCDPAFLESTRTAVQSWRFVPARLRGRSVAVRFQQDIEFTLPDR